MVRMLAGAAIVAVAVGCGGPPPRTAAAVSGPLSWSVCGGSNDDSQVEVALVAPSGQRVTVGRLYESCYMLTLDGDPAVGCNDVHSDRRAVARVRRHAGAIEVLRVEMRRPIVEDDAPPGPPPPPRVVEQTTAGVLHLPEGTAISRDPVCAEAPRQR